MLEHFCLFFSPQSTSHCLKTMNLHHKRRLSWAAHWLSVVLLVLPLTARVTHPFIYPWWHFDIPVNSSDVPYARLLPHGQASVPGHSRCIMHETSAPLSTVWRTDTSAIRKLCVPNSPGSPRVPHRYLQSHFLLCLQLAELGGNCTVQGEML